MVTTLILEEGGKGDLSLDRLQRKWFEKENDK